MKWWREFLNCQLPATYYPPRRPSCLMGPELHCGRLLLPLRKDAFDTHLYDHVAILQ